MKICWSLFNELEMDIDGSAYLCCAQRVSKTPMGNIFTDDFEKGIWNCEMAVKMREAALQGKYPYCNHQICHKLSGDKNILFDYVMPFYKPVMEKYPVTIAFPMGRDCNAKCIFCRDEIITSTQEEFELFQDRLKNIYLPIMKNVEVITVNDLGDAFGSKLSREVIKMITQKYPNIKFKIMTNGICASEKLIKELDLVDRIMEFSISINAIKEETHYKIFRVGGWKTLLKNLKFIAKLNKQEKIPHFHFKFVVCNENWQEMAKFVKFAQKYGANADFWEIRDYWQGLENKYEDMAVHHENHKDFEAFKKSLVNPIFDKKCVTLSPLLIEIRNKALQEQKTEPKKSFLRRFFK